MQYAKVPTPQSSQLDVSREALCSILLVVKKSNKIQAKSSWVLFARAQ